MPFFGGKLHFSQDSKRNGSDALIEEGGGEPLAGSGFESEEPEAGFYAADSEGEA